MLPSHARLTRVLFTQFLSSPGQQVVYNRLGTLKWIPAEKKHSCVVTSSKHEKRAVVRNNVRRRVYTLFQTMPYPGIYVLYVSKQSYGMEFIEIQQLFNDLVTKMYKNSRESA